MAFNLYFQLTLTNQRILKDYDTNAELIQLRSVLSTDFERYNNIEYSIYELRFKNKTKECIYEFSDIGILRKFQEKTDTFAFEYSNLEYKLQNGNSGMVRNLSFNVNYHSETLPFAFYKDYQNESNINKQVFN